MLRSRSCSSTAPSSGIEARHGIQMDHMEGGRGRPRAHWLPRCNCSSRSCRGGRQRCDDQGSAGQTSPQDRDHHDRLRQDRGRLRSSGTPEPILHRPLGALPHHWPCLRHGDQAGSHSRPVARDEPGHAGWGGGRWRESGRRGRTNTGTSGRGGRRGATATDRSCSARSSALER